MKTARNNQGNGKWLALAVGVLALAGCGPVYVEDRWYAQDYYSHGPAPAQPRVQGSVAVATIAPDPQFADLTPYGTWEMTGEYGRIWVPYANRTPGWRPYFYGSWVYTQWGWSWVSDESWGAGPYHYGRWTWMNGRNWVWIPDYTWGPAWVTWSHGGGCVGWAPMGPGGVTYVDLHAHHTYWTYVPTAQFGGSHVQHVVVTAADVPRIHQQTVVVDNSTPIRGTGGQVVTYNAGPPRDTVQQWTARPVTPRAIDETPQIQPRRIPDNVTPPAGGSWGTATQPSPTRPGPGGGGVGTPPVTSTPGIPDTRGTGPVNPTTPQPRPGVATTPPVTTPPTYTPPVTPNPTRPGVGTNPPVTNPPVTTPPVTNPSVPTRPGPGTGAVTPNPEPPTRPGTSTQDPPTRPGTGYTGPGPINLPPQPTVPRPTPPPADRGNYAPPPARYTPPTYTPPANTAPQNPAPQSGYNPAQPTRAATPSYQPTPAYNPGGYNPAQPTRPATPSYQPAPSYNPAPAYRPAPSYQPAQRPSYNPAPSAAPPARFSPPPSFTPPPSRPAATPVPAPTRRR